MMPSIKLLHGISHGSWINYFQKVAVLSLLVVVTLKEVSSRSTNASPSPQQFSIESNTIQRIFTEKGRPTIIDSSRALKRVFLSNRTVTCNDGSQAGFYLRKSLKSKRWVIFLEGGWHCYDLNSCRTRWVRLRHLMTSAQWTETRDVGGILSSIQADNPYWYDANHVLVPYCSSDSWSGTKIRAEARDGWSFMGSLIVRQVISDLIPLGLGRSHGGELLLAGSSAGGLGVMLNLDKLKKYLRHERGIKMTVRGVSDSGWFLDRAPYAPGAVATVDVVKQGYKLWGGALPDSCVKKHPTEPWRCYFGHRIYPTMNSPLFVFQWLFDEAQMRADSVGAPVTPQQWDYIHDMGGALRTSLDNVTAVFAPSCIGHAVLTKRDWLNIKIDDISLAEALRCWELATSKRNKNGLQNNPNGKQRRHNRNRRKKDENVKDNAVNGGNGNTISDKDVSNLGDSQSVKHKLTKEERKKKRMNLTEEQKQMRRKNRNKKRNKNRKDDNCLPVNPLAGPERMHNLNRSSNENNSVLNCFFNKNKRNETRSLHHQNDSNLRRHRNNHGDSNSNNNRNRKSQRQRRKSFIGEPKKCSLRLLERCSWPQCNHSCPTLTNPLTGEEMRFLELLSSFGLDIEAVAAALGVDMQTLNNMDHTELVNLLTQQVS